MLNFVCLVVCTLFLCDVVKTDISTAYVVKKPTIVVALLARNKAHILPYSLTLIEQLEYPKNRISLWIRSDHNIDNTEQVLTTWVNSIKSLYHSVHLEIDNDERKFNDEFDQYHWSEKRFDHIIRAREEAFEFARNVWADYILFIDADVLLTEPQTLASLVEKRLPIVAPMLQSDGLYSNFWAGMTAGGYYERTSDYEPILKRERTGCWAVPMVHTCVLVWLRAAATDALTFVPAPGDPHDDIIALARSANRTELPMHVCNELVYGRVTAPVERDDPPILDAQRLQNARLAVLEEGDEPLPVAPSLRRFIPQTVHDTLGFERIFMINLRRRPERRARMLHCFDALAMRVDVVDAVDGRALNESQLSAVTLMPEYTDPYHKRPMKLGEIGCFLSHYSVWQEIAAQGYSSALVLEDDVRFEPFFRARVERLVHDLAAVPDWDLVYLGRKRMPRTRRRRPRNKATAANNAEEEQEDEFEDVYYDEPWVPGSDMLVRAGYSYWTLGYVITAKGARKLLDARPLNNLLPVDEFLPIMFDRHPRDDWTQHYSRRDLLALSTAPLLIYPTHYTGDTGYISDTEDTLVVPNHARQPSASLHSTATTHDDL